MTDERTRRARVAVGAVFFIHGLIVATRVSRIPALQDNLGLSSAALGNALASIWVGSLLSMPVTGVLVHHLGSRAMVLAAALGLCVSLPLIGLATNAWWLSLAFGAFGCAAGAMGVSMNAQGAAIEQRYGRPIMASFHGLFSLGGMIGSIAGGSVAASGVAPLPHFTMSAAVYGTLMLLPFPSMLRGTAAAGGPRLSLRVPRSVLALGLLSFCVLVGEGAMADWAAVYLRSAGAGPGTAAAGYAVFSAAMAAGRLTGDRLCARFGRVAMVRAGTLLGALGYALALAVHAEWLSLAGFAVVGCGFAVVVPTVLGAAGRIPGVPAGAGIAAVTTLGYLGFLAGPPMIGYAAELAGLRAALVIVPVLALIASTLAGHVEPER